MGSFFRRPLGAFATVLVVGFAVIAVGMSAFGGGASGGQRPSHSAKALTPAQFRRAGDRIGLSFCLQLKPIVNRKPRTLREFRRNIRKITAIFDGLRTKLYGLVPPSSEAASFQRLRGNFDAFDHAMHRLDHLAETGQWRRFVLLARSRWFKDIVRRFGPIEKGRLRCSRAGRTTL